MENGGRVGVFYSGFDNAARMYPAFHFSRMDGKTRMFAMFDFSGMNLAARIYRSFHFLRMLVFAVIVGVAIA
jgi:hypothetical protein